MTFMNGESGISLDRLVQYAVSVALDAGIAPGASTPCDRK